jgi:hypothetical protein
MFLLLIVRLIINLSASSFQRQEKLNRRSLSNGRTVMLGVGQTIFATPTAVLMMGGRGRGIFIITGFVFIFIAKAH